MESKAFAFSVVDGASMLRVIEKRKLFFDEVFMSI
jgi:hypothetical protein